MCQQASGSRGGRNPVDQPGGQTQECALGFYDMYWGRLPQKPRVDLPIRVGNITTGADAEWGSEHRALLISKPINAEP